MKVTREKTENSQVFLTIEMEPAEVEESLEESYRRLAKKVNVPGFRKGKVPRAVLEGYIGRESLLEEALNRLLPEAYEKAVKEQEIEAIAQPQIDVIQTDPLVFKAVVPIKPVVKLGDYRGLRLEAEPVQLGDDDVNAAIEEIRRRYATWEPVERPVDFSDTVTLDIESTIEEEPFINRKQSQYQVLPKFPFPVPGFAEQLVGMKIDEEKEFKLEFPADYPRNELAGKEASFVVKVTEVKQEILSELNDEFAREVNPEWESLDSLREQVSDDLRSRAEERARRDFEERVIEAAVELAEVEFPPILVEEEISRLLQERARYWQTGGQGLEEYLRSINKTEEELRQELYPVAERSVIRSLVVGKVAEEEKIEVTDDEISAEIDDLTRSTGGSKDEWEKLLSTPESRRSVERWLIGRKAVQRLVEIAGSSDADTSGGAEDEAKG